MTNLLLKSFLLSGVACMIGTAPAYAQQSDTAPAKPAASKATDNEDANAIVVTARRTEERLQDVPISITVFSQQQLTSRNIVNAGDLATYTPSLSANGRFGAENTAFAIRGFIQEGPTSPSVGVYFADVISPRSNGGTTNGNGGGPGNYFDLQNVQVLKGPQGTLFGRNTTGGAVLLVPQRPTDKFEGYLEGTVGDYGLIRTQGVINVPLSDTIRVRIGGDRQSRNGYLRNVGSTGPKDFGDVNYYALRGSIVIDVTPDIENYTVLSYNNSETNGNLPKMFCVIAGAVCANPATPGVVPTGYRSANYAAQILATPGYYDVSNNDPGAHQSIRQWQAINNTTWTVNDSLKIRNIVSYSQFRQRQDESIYGDNGFDPATGQINYAVSVMPAPGKYNAAMATFTEELQFQGRIGGDRFVYQIGGYYEHASPLEGFQTTVSPSFLSCSDVLALQCTDLRGRATSNGAGGNLEGRVGSMSISQSKYYFDNKGLYAQATYKIFDQLSVTGGIRYTWDDARGIGQSRKLNFPAPNTPTYSCSQPVGAVTGGTSAQLQADPSLCRFTREVKSSKPTWLLDLEYRATDDIMVYAKYARGYRQGSINVTSYGLETWQPEKVDTYEIGVKTGWHGDAVSGTFNVSGFYNDFTNQQIQSGLIACTTISLPQCPFIPASAAGIANAGSSTIKGVEIEAALTFFEHFRVDAGYSYLDARIKTLTIPAPPLGFTGVNLTQPPAGGNPISLTPENQYTVTGTYTLPFDESVGRISIGLTYSHRDSTFGSTSSRVAQQTLPPQNLLNLNVSWNKVLDSPVDLGVFVTNLTNEHFYTFTTGASFGFDSFIPNQPRMFGLRAKVHFGK